MKWRQYQREVGISNEFLAAQLALRYVAQLPFQFVTAIYPELVSRVEEHFRMSFADQTTLEDLMFINKESREWILSELFCGAQKHISALFVRYLAKHSIDKVEHEKIYPLFMLSKYICRKKSHFAWTL